MDFRQSLYMDYNATAPVLPVVAARMDELARLPLNPSSIHAYGREARRLVEATRTRLAEMLSVWPTEIVFTGSGTESNNLAVRGLADSSLVVSAVEHTSVLNVAKRLGGQFVPVDGQGLLCMRRLEEALQLCNVRPLVSVILANNETGVVQEMAEIAALVHRYGGLLHCDAVQAFGKMPLDFGLLGVDMMTVAAHKIGGPVGVGALVVRSGISLNAQMVGGGQEGRRRAGTENVAAIAGWDALMQHLPDLSQQQGWREAVEAAMLKAAPGARVMGEGVRRLPNTLCITMPGVSSETQLMNFDLSGICVSAGSACSSGRIEASHVLLAMGLEKAEASTALRISGGWGTSEADWQAVVQGWVALFARLGAMEAA